MEVIREFKEEGKCGANSYVGATMNLSPEKQGTFIPCFEVCLFHNHESLICPNHSELFSRVEFILKETQDTHLHIIYQMDSSFLQGWFAREYESQNISRAHGISHQFNWNRKASNTKTRNHF